MNKLWILAFALGTVSADVGLGYEYKVPQTSYGVPSYQYHSTLGQNIGYTDSSSNGYNYKQSANKFLDHVSVGDHSFATSAQRYGVPNYQTSTYQHGTTTNNVQSYPSSISSLGTNTGSTFVHSGPQYQTHNEYLSSTAQKHQQFYVQQQTPEVYKHFYVHSAPEEPELPRPRQPIVLPPPQKHYKIIFVKAPTETRGPQIVPVPPQNEEKTIVYVLVKKPEEQEVILPKVEQKPPAKPEVYFVKYNTKHDSQAVIDNIVNNYNKGNVVTGPNHAYDPIYNSNLQDGQTASSFGGNVIAAPLHAPTPTTFVINDIAPPKGSGAFGTSTNQVATGHFSNGHLSNGHPTTGALSTGSLSSGALSTGGLSTGTFSPVSSTTVSSLAYDHGKSISTSQGIPHESYGPPKFRPN